MNVPMIGFCEDTRRPLEKSARECTSEEIERKWFADLLWEAFPEARSDNELSELAAEVLTKGNRPVDSRTVRNWLRLTHAPHYRYVPRVYALAKSERLFDMIFGKE